jgi:hypothetical protein
VVFIASQADASENAGSHVEAIIAFERYDTARRHLVAEKDGRGPLGAHHPLIDGNTLSGIHNNLLLRLRIGDNRAVTARFESTNPHHNIHINGHNFL